MLAKFCYQQDNIYRNLIQALARVLILKSFSNCHTYRQKMLVPQNTVPIYTKLYKTSDPLCDVFLMNIGSSL